MAQLGAREWVNRRSIGQLMGGGFVLLILMLAGLAGYSFNTILKLDRAFQESVEATQINQALGKDVVNVLEAQIGAFEYQQYGDAESIAAVAEHIDSVVNHSDVRALVGEGSNLALALEDISYQLLIYGGAFDEMVALSRQTDDVVDQLGMFGPLARQRLSELMQEAYESGDYRAAYQAGLVQEQLVLARYYTMLFYGRGDEDSFTRANEHIENAIRRCQSLMMFLRLPPMNEWVLEIDEHMRAYRDLLPALEESLYATQETQMYALTPIQEGVRDLIAQESEQISEQQAMQQLETAQVFGQAQRSLLILVLSAVVVAIAFGWVVVVMVNRRFAQLLYTTEALANGEVDVEVTGSEHKHEIGRVNAALKVFQNAQMEQLEVRDQEQLRMAETAKFVLELSTGLEGLAKGDLTVQVDETADLEFQALSKNFNHSIVQLQQIIAKVSDTSNGIADGMEAVASASQELASRTDRQAQALAATTSTVSQIKEEIAQTSESCQEATVLVQTAHDKAGNGIKVVAQTVDAMERIKKSSDEISLITAVLDDIAFQTTLLALNAGVEAARAGDAGRGFAVVAKEVQTLASRAGEAAGDINTLIQTSSDEVSEGARLANETDVALSEIVDVFSVVNEAVHKIADTTRAQVLGVNNITDSMVQLDQLTNENAAMVEETTAATFQLKADVSSMQDSTSVLTLPLVEEKVQRRAG